MEPRNQVHRQEATLRDADAVKIAESNIGCIGSARGIQARRAGVPSALERVRQAARRYRKLRFTALLHHVYAIEQLWAAYFALKRDATPSVDGETWRRYGENLEMNLRGLSQRLRRGLTELSRFVGHTSRRRMGGEGHLESLRWKIRLSSVPSSRY